MQHLGKPKLPSSDSIKPSRSKLRRTSKDHADQHSPTANEVFRDIPTDPSMRLDEFWSCFPDAGMPDFDGDFMFDIDGEVAPLGTLETAPFNFGTDLTSGLDDFSILPEFTDIG